MKASDVTLEEIASYGNLLVAHAMARRGKTKYKSVQEFEENKDELLHKLSESLLNGTYRTSGYKVEVINDRGKDRQIMKLPYYPDRIVHWAIMLYLEPVFNKVFSTESHAAIAGKGIHSALHQLRHALLTDAEGTKYCLKLDVKKYFPHINHTVLKYQMARLVSDKRVLKLICEIIDSVDEGIPIGNYLSQYFANLYLSKFDIWVHQVLGVKHYVRYMDDIVIFSDSKDTLRKWFREVEWYLKRNLYLDIKENWQMFPTNVRGVDFLGYRIKSNSVMLRKRLWLNMQRSCRKSIRLETVSDSQRSSVMAYVGWLYHCTDNVWRVIYDSQLTRLFIVHPELIPKSILNETNSKRKLRLKET